MKPGQRLQTVLKAIFKVSWTTIKTEVSGYTSANANYIAIQLDPKNYVHDNQECWEAERGHIQCEVRNGWNYVPHRNGTSLCLWQVVVITMQV